MTTQEWTAALRSGKYEQGKSYLRTEDNKFCCLGVLCDLYDSEGWETSTRDRGSYGFIPRPYNEHTQLPPNIVREAIPGLTPEMMDHLAEHNDEGKTFSEIADMIDAGLENIPTSTCGSMYK